MFTIRPGKARNFRYAPSEYQLDDVANFIRSFDNAPILYFFESKDRKTSFLVSVASEIPGTPQPFTSVTARDNSTLWCAVEHPKYNLFTLNVLFGMHNPGEPGKAVDFVNGIEDVCIAFDLQHLYLNEVERVFKAYDDRGYYDLVVNQPDLALISDAFQTILFLNAYEEADRLSYNAEKRLRTLQNTSVTRGLLEGRLGHDKAKALYNDLFRR